MPVHHRKVNMCMHAEKKCLTKFKEIYENDKLKFIIAIKIDF